MKSTMQNNLSLKLNTCSNMKKYGSGFVKALAECILRADKENLFKLEEAFNDYITTYHPDNWGKNEDK